VDLPRNEHVNLSFRKRGVRFHGNIGSSTEVAWRSIGVSGVPGGRPLSDVGLFAILVFGLYADVLVGKQMKCRVPCCILCAHVTDCKQLCVKRLLEQA
jgi:hypothetical protein